MQVDNAAREDARSGELRLTLMGGFALNCAGRVICVPQSAQRLVAFLAIHPRVLARGYVAGSLWPDGTQARSFASLRSALWRLRRTGMDIVRVTPGSCELTHNIRVDAREVATQVQRLMDLYEPCTPSDLDPVLLMGELLPGWFDDDWLLIERERLRQMCLHGLEALCQRLRTLGRYGAAVEAGLAAVRGEPLRESAHRALIEVHLAEGNHCEALRQYHWFRRYLYIELRLQPSPQLLSLVEGLLVPG
jgi:DNA-binding SARP family transcriptional activator